MANKSATLIGTIQFDLSDGRGGCRNNTLHVGHNASTGEPILWQQVGGQRSSSITGRNLRPFLEELEHVLNEGEARWLTEPNMAALEALQAAVRV